MLVQAKEIQQRLRGLVETALDLDDAVSVNCDTPLFSGDLGLDSVDMVSLIVAVERHFGIEFAPDTDFERHFSCIDSIAAHIDELRGGQERHAGLS